MVGFGSDDDIGTRTDFRSARWLPTLNWPCANSFFKYRRSRYSLCIRNGMRVPS